MAGARATVLCDGRRHDVCVPDGTTVTGLLSMLELPSTGALSVRLSDGRRAEPGMVVGRDVPDGAVLAVSDDRRSTAAVARAEDERGRRGMLPLLADVTALLLVLAAAGVLLAGLTAGHDLGWGRAVVAAPATLAAVVFAQRHRDADVTRRVLVPVLAATPLLAAPDPAGPLAWNWALLAVVTGAAVAAFLQWLDRGVPATGAAALVWIMTALLVAGLVFAGLHAATVAVTLFGVGVVTVCLAPLYAMPVPERQLVDLPLLTSTSPRVRAPQVEPPDEIGPDLVRGLLGRGTSVTEALVLVGCVVAAAAAPFLALEWEVSVRALGTLVLVVVAVGALTLVARSQTSRVVRLVPRATALLVVAVLGLRAAGDLTLAWVVPGTLVGLGVALLLGTLLVVREPRSALPGRLGDVTQAWCLTLLLPAVFCATGLFDQARLVFS